MAAALRAFLWKILRCQQLAGVLLGRPDVDDLRGAGYDLVEDVIAERADRRVRASRPVLGLSERRRVGRQRTFLGDPLCPAAVHQLGVLVPVVLQQPEEPGGEPVVVIAVRHDRRLGRDPVLRQERFQLLLVEKVAHRMLLEIDLPVEADRAGNVPLVVGRRVHVDLEDADIWILRVLREPFGLDENVLGGCGHVLFLQNSLAGPQ